MMNVGPRRTSGSVAPGLGKVMDLKHMMSLAHRLGEYADQSAEAPAEVEETFTVPEDFSELSTEELAALQDKTITVFDQKYAKEAGQDELAPLVKVIEELAVELDARAKLVEEETAAMEKLAAQVEGLRPSEPEAEVVEPEAETGEEDSGEFADTWEEPEVEETPEPVVAREKMTLSLRKVQRSQPKPSAPAEVRPDMRELVVSTGDGTGFAVGAGLDWDTLAEAVDRKLQGYSHTQFQAAANVGRHLKQQHSVAAFRKPFADGQIVDSDGQQHVDAAIAFAVDQKRLPGRSLVASGGWGAPSETLYDFLELETREGMMSMPEIGVRRGGVRFTQGPSFADIYAQFPGFNYTEAEDIAGTYKDEGGTLVEGPKPVVRIDMPTFEDVRMETAGLAIQAGLLGARGYPEAIARVLRGAMVAHDHRMNAALIERTASLSTDVTMNAGVGATAPLLEAVELQAEHYRSAHRLGFNQPLEAVFPHWLRGVIHSDLAQRAGVDLIDVDDARILGWFRKRFIVPQFVYDWQSLDTEDAADFKAWPGQVTFLLYAAGTFVRGSSEVITLDTLYDSTLLSQNDYSALFTEEGWLVLKRGHDSRAVTVPVTPNGETASTVVVNVD